MKWYAAWGHNEFVLCLGYKGECIKQYFLDYNEALSNDFVLSNGGRDVELLGQRHLATGRSRSSTRAPSRRSPSGCCAVAPHLGDDEYFLATYGDGLTDAPLADMIERLGRRGKTGSSSPSGRMFNAHVVDADDDGTVHSIEDIQEADVWINGGFFVLRRNILDYINPGEELVVRAVPPAHRAGRAHRVPLRGLLGADGHDQGQAAARRARGERPRAVAQRRPSARRCLADAPALRSRDGGEPVRRVLALGAHADDIEIGCGAHDPRADASAAGARGDLGRASARRASARGGARERRARSSRAPRRRMVVIHGFRDGFSRTWAAQVKDVFEELKRECRPGSDPHARAARPAPGPPARLRAHLEHVARPPDPRVRDPEVRRRSRDARTSSYRSRRSSRRRRSDAHATRSRASAGSTGSTAELFLGLMRLRGMEARAASGYAEAFACRKLSLALG